MFNGLGTLKSPPTFLDYTTKEKSAEATKELTQVETESAADEKPVATEAEVNIQEQTEDMVAFAQLTGDADEDSAVVTVAIVVGIILGTILIASITFAIAKRRKIK